MRRERWGRPAPRRPAGRGRPRGHARLRRAARTPRHWPTPPRGRARRRCGGRAGRRRAARHRRGRCAGSPRGRPTSCTCTPRSRARSAGCRARGMPLIYTPHGYAFGRTGAHRSTHAAVRAAEGLIARRCPRRRGLGDRGGAGARRPARAAGSVVRNGIPELDDGVVERQPGASLPRSPPAGSSSSAAGRPARGSSRSSHPSPASLDRRRAGEEAAARCTRPGSRSPAGCRERRAAELGGRPSSCTGRRGTVSRSPSSRRSRATSWWSRPTFPPTGKWSARARCAPTSAPPSSCSRGAGRPISARELLAEQRRRAPAFGARRMAAEWLALYERVLSPAAATSAQPASPARAVRNIGGPWT